MLLLHHYYQFPIFVFVTIVHGSSAWFQLITWLCYFVWYDVNTFLLEQVDL
ncbi:hypothetical protein KTH52_10940 [Acinetobacter baumannii]|nr:hypothetical protein [Acinetobacter baumannii]